MLSLRRLLPLACLAVGLAACADFSRLDAGLSGLEGRHREDAMRILGFPNALKKLDGRDVYIWTTGEVGETPPVADSCGDRYGGGIAATHCIAAPAWFRERHCTIRITSDAKGIITSASRDGDSRTCGRYARKFAPPPR
ncbi:hypothetical protein [Oleispirillum naphthae]|uniref:hypothetical protein n=1 Tax=Oleispirillum naphthae TaxID=2838853 RepID=UPI0030825BDD